MGTGLLGSVSMRWLILCATTAVIGCGLLIYSLTYSFYWDEGFHLLTAQMINRGNRPYIDFFFPQPPLNAYWNAAWMNLVRDDWRVVHVVAATSTLLAILLASDFSYRNCPDPNWRVPAGVTTAVLFGLNTVVVTFSTIGQAYALCLLLIMSAFRLAIAASGRTNLLWAAATGLAIGAAASSSLLTAPIAPVLLVWLLYSDRTGKKFFKFVAFSVGALIPFLPIVWLTRYGLRQVVFNVIEYHLLYRRAGWDGALSHDAEVVTSWMESGQTLLLGVLAVSGIVLAGSSDACTIRRNPHYLCAAIVVVEALWLANIHPTFNQYFVFLVPFLAILGATGLRNLAGRFGSADRPLWPVLAVASFTAFGLERSLLEQRGNLSWSDVEAISAKVIEVTPAASPFLADEFIYFQTKRGPPPGLEHADVRKLSLPDPPGARLNVKSADQVEAYIKEGRFGTIVSCDDEFSESAGLKILYARMQKFNICTVYWDLNTPPPSAVK